jgi:DNA-binding NtrC family response regulator
MRSEAGNQLPFRSVIDRVARLQESVLLVAEVGPVAEQLARDIHQQGDRSGHPFAALMVSTMSADALDAELFGLAKGEKGALRERTGLLALIGRGTLFLDDVGQLPAGVQQRLARVLATGTVRAAGQDVPLKARIVSSSRDSLSSLVGQGQFSADLYFRLGSVVVEVPSLRQRADEVPGILLRVLDGLTGDTQRCRSFDDEATHALCTWPWPNGSRDLPAMAEFIAARCKGAVVRMQDLPLYLQKSRKAPSVSLGDLVPLDDIERAHVIAVLQRVGGNKARASTVLQIGRKTLYRKLAGWGIPLDENEIRQSIV